MQTNLEQMTKEYSIACAKAVRDTIHKLAAKWDKELIDALIYDGLESVSQITQWRIK